MKNFSSSILKKSVITILLLSLMIISAMIGVSKLSIIQVAAVNYEEKIIHEIDESAQYDNKILAVLDKNISGVNKKHEDSLFGSFPKLQITELTEVGDTQTTRTSENFRQIFEITLPSCNKEEVCEAISELNTMPGILTATPNYSYETETIKTSNDSYYSSQWSLHGKAGMRVPLAWGITTGSSNIRVGIIDTGIAYHPDLNDNLVSGVDFSYSNSSPNDDVVGHGTSVAGIIGAVGNNAQGVAGINWNVSLVPLQAEGEGWGKISTSSVVKAIKYATDTYWTNARISVLNYSVSGFGASPIVLSAIQEYPGLFVWSAGNNGATIDNASSYNLNNIISVGAIDQNSNRSIWNTEESSAYGNSVDIFAAGTKVKTTAINNTYCEFGGTSAAAPNVAGAAALLLSYDSSLTATELKNIILKYADDIEIENRTAKRLNIGSAIWSLKYSDKIELRNMGHFDVGGGCNGNSDGWTIKVSNNSNSKMNVIYNKKMCFENDAINWTGLGDVDYFDLQAGESKTVDIESNAFATHVAFSYVVGNKRYITYANEFNSANNMFNPNLSTVNYPSYTNISLIGKNGATWIVNVKNNSSQSRKLEYNKKMCNLNDAKNWTGLKDINNDEIVLSAYENKIIRITENGFADSIAISLVNTNENLRYIYYANQLNVNCTMSVYSNTISATQQTDDNCIAAGTLITLANGEKKPVELLSGDEMLLVWNLFTGTYDSAPILFIDEDPVETYEVIELLFSDGTSVDVISEHGFWDVDLNKYVYIDKYTTEYIGHKFLKQGESNMVEVTLTNVNLVEKTTAAYSPVTYGHLCYYVNGMLSMPGGIEGLFNIFEVDNDNMKYNANLMAGDIERYGTFTYEEFNAIVPVPEVMFNAVNGQYLKVALGKGLITIEKIRNLIDRYSVKFQSNEVAQS